MRVKVRAVIQIDGRLILSRRLRRGREELSLPVGRVHPRESVLDALKREVAEETGLQIVPRRLLYIAEDVQGARVHELELVFLAESAGVPMLNVVHSVDPDPRFPPVRPPILGEIVCDVRTGWRQTPRWLGNLQHDRHRGASVQRERT